MLRNQQNDHYTMGTIYTVQILAVKRYGIMEYNIPYLELWKSLL